jgi:hypothetical protein
VVNFLHGGVRWMGLTADLMQVEMLGVDLMETRLEKNTLRHTDWNPVLVDNDTDSSFNKFWDIFQALYEEHFPVLIKISTE